VENCHSSTLTFSLPPNICHLSMTESEIISREKIGPPQPPNIYHISVPEIKITFNLIFDIPESFVPHLLFIAEALAIPQIVFKRPFDASSDIGNASSPKINAVLHPIIHRVNHIQALQLSAEMWHSEQPFSSSSSSSQSTRLNQLAHPESHEVEYSPA
jgi:hypothetical protein